MRPLLPTVLAALLPACASAPPAPSPSATGADAAAVTAVVHDFHAALAAGDSAAALALLTDDVLVLESGGLETRDEYRSHHLPADIEFARAVAARRGELQVRVSDDVAWAASTSTTTGEFRERAINAAGAELMVLVRTTGGWRIAAIHWSSRTLRP
jgi:ketosteroid isomerase-like protein